MEYPRNSKTHPLSQVEKIADSIKQFGWRQPILIADDGEIIAGHGRLMAAKLLGLKECPCVVAADLTDAQRKAYRIADNRLAELGDWDFSLLQSEVQELSMQDFSIKALGWDHADLIAKLAPDGDLDQPSAPGALIDDYLEPPLSVLQVSSGRWQARKKAWLSVLPIDYAQVGREHNLVNAGSSARTDPQYYKKKAQVEQRVGRKLTRHEFEQDYYQSPDTRTANGTSMFDPVLAELMTIWYSPQGGVIIDPFAGDVERGLVAAAKGREYHGIDVRQEQCAANANAATQWGKHPMPTWTHGDSSKIAGTEWGAASADMIFSCPPYWNLEKYSDDPGDLSNMSLIDFGIAHAAIVRQCCEALKPDSFAVWVIGDVRNGDGWARLPALATEHFHGFGLQLHAEMVLVTTPGSKAMTARKSFDTYRRVTRRHEYVLVFCKGDPGKAAKRMGQVQIGGDPDG